MALRFLTLCGVFSLAQAANPTAYIGNGVVIGTQTRISNQPANTGLVNAYLGVPFAKSPPERFSPPAAASNWATPYMAQKQPPACLQQFLAGQPGEREKKVFNNPFNAPPVESEDCLYLNVFAPQGANAFNLKPVMFWIYGGNLQIGAASLAFYNGSSLAINQDVVVVVANYRSNIFGFSNSDQISPGLQNSGFLDQRFALNWVQQNIMAFGGDPTRVTIFGESAGGYSVKQILAQPPATRQFSAAIMESQEIAFTGNGLANYKNVLQHFNCATAPSPIDCLRLVKGTDIQAYITAQSLTFPAVDDATHMTNVLPSITSGRFSNVPILIGTNKDEITVFLYILGLDPGATNITTLIPNLGFNFTNITAPLASPYSQAIQDNSFQLANRIGTDLLFTCTTQTLSTAIVAAGRQQVWRYQYDGDFPNLSSFPNAGAYHITEIPEVWGTYPVTTPYGTVTANQIALSSYMQGIWAGFAKGNSPNWPRLGSNGGRELALLGSSQNATGSYVVPLSDVDYPCVLFDPVLILSNKAF